MNGDDKPKRVLVLTPREPHDKEKKESHTVGPALGPERGALRLVSDRPRPSDFETFDRVVAIGPRYRQRALEPWRPKRRKRRQGA